MLITVVSVLVPLLALIYFLWISQTVKAVTPSVSIPLKSGGSKKKVPLLPSSFSLLISFVPPTTLTEALSSIQFKKTSQKQSAAIPLPEMKMKKKDSVLSHPLFFAELKELRGSAIGTLDFVRGGKMICAGLYDRSLRFFQVEDLLNKARS